MMVYFLVSIRSQRLTALRKSPYASFHTFSGSLAFATGGLDLNYTGNFVDVFGKVDFFLEGVLRSDRFAFAYYGLGNETELITDDFDFNRVRQSMVSVYPALRQPISALGVDGLLGHIMSKALSKIHRVDLYQKVIRVYQMKFLNIEDLVVQKLLWKY
jgi:hypothetical protein